MRFSLQCSVPLLIFIKITGRFEGRIVGAVVVWNMGNRGTGMQCTQRLFIATGICIVCVVRVLKSIMHISTATTKANHHNICNIELGTGNSTDKYKTHYGFLGGSEPFQRLRITGAIVAIGIEGTLRSLTAIPTKLL
jgi:hypothetical protein